MARIRTIKPEFPHSESLGRVSRDARLCFVLLWTQADDSGRLRGSSRMLASLLFPYDDDAPALMDGWLGDLERIGSIRRYEVDGKHYIDIPNWLKHQRIDHPGKSAHPDFVASSRTFASPREASREDQGPRKGREGTKEGTKECSTELSVISRTPFDNFWELYPRKIGKGAARKAYAEAIRKAGPDDIEAGVARFRAGLNGTDPKFIPHPATWLNAERWLDDPPPHKPTASDILNEMRDRALVEEAGDEQTRIS